MRPSRLPICARLASWPSPTFRHLGSECYLYPRLLIVRHPHRRSLRLYQPDCRPQTKCHHHLSSQKCRCLSLRNYGSGRCLRIPRPLARRPLPVGGKPERETRHLQDYHVRGSWRQSWRTTPHRMCQRLTAESPEARAEKMKMPSVLVSAVSSPATIVFPQCC